MNAFSYWLHTFCTPFVHFKLVATPWCTYSSAAATLLKALERLDVTKPHGWTKHLQNMLLCKRMASYTSCVCFSTIHGITSTINVVFNLKTSFFFSLLANTDNSNLHCTGIMVWLWYERMKYWGGRRQRSIFLQALNQSSGRQRAVRSSKLRMCDACSYTLGMIAGSRIKKNATLWNISNFFWGEWVISSALCIVWKHQTGHR